MFSVANRMKFNPKIKHQKKVDSNNCSLPRLSSRTKKIVSAGIVEKSLEEQKTSNSIISNHIIQPKLDLSKPSKRPETNYKETTTCTVKAKREDNRLRFVCCLIKY